MTTENLLQICVVGDSGTGKTSFILGGCPDCLEQTIGIDSCTITKEINGELFKLHLLDCPGKKECIKAYPVETRGAFVMIDATKDNTTNENSVLQWIQDLKSRIDWDKYYPSGVYPIILLI